MEDMSTNRANGAGRDMSADTKPGPLGEHPVGVGLGAVGTGAAAGAAGGAIGGPVGAVAGAAIGAVVGGLAGKAAAEAINPTIETKYWQDHHASGPYSKAALGYDEYAPAYRYGWESFGRLGASEGSFESIEGDLGKGWDKAKGQSKLGWDEAKSATRDAWDRVKRTAHSAVRSAT